ncbi:hypothetical protein DR64_8176 [Paraburkholderia xenovorans LB400]|nr:hypothetical protein DR64_8176 [Paraburkholderia xenovorans LB400]
MHGEHTDTWSQTVALLDHGLAHQMMDTLARIAAAHPQKTAWSHHPALTVRVIERTSARTVSVSWCDPLSGYYGYQSWHASLARRRASCVLSGEPISRGDPVYQPSSRPSRPGNAGAMILASRVDAALRVDHQPAGHEVAAGATGRTDGAGCCGLQEGAL